uniref:Ig-like domain-containing protein n=1 Tax=Maylandia zebra TaxID=106582 RepID=A0A3P9BZ57_9CICH
MLIQQTQHNTSVLRVGTVFQLLCLLYKKLVAYSIKTTPIVDKNQEVQINCKHDDSTRILMFWYQQRKENASMTLIGSGYYQQSQNYEGQFKEQFTLTRNSAVEGTLTIKNTDVSHSAVYFCAFFMQQFISVNNYEPAYFGSGTKLTVLDPIKPKVTVLEPSVNECKNKKDKKRKKTLVCVATEFYPDHVKVFWQIDGKNITDGVATDEAAERIETPSVSYRITSRLRVSAKDWFTKGKNFSCIVSFYNGTDTTKYLGEISGIEGKFRKKYLMITNKAKLSYAVFIFKSCLYGAFVGFLVWRLQVC